jgi:hypothetical protein
MRNCECINTVTRLVGGKEALYLIWRFLGLKAWTLLTLCATRRGYEVDRACGDTKTSDTKTSGITIFGFTDLGNENVNVYTLRLRHSTVF